MTIERPAFLHDAPQFGAYRRRPLQGAVTMLNDLEDTLGEVMTMVRPPASKYLHAVSLQGHNEVEVRIPRRPCWQKNMYLIRSSRLHEVTLLVTYNTM